MEYVKRVRGKRELCKCQRETYMWSKWEEDKGRQLETREKISASRDRERREREE